MSDIEENNKTNDSTNRADDYLRFRLPDMLKKKYKMYCYLVGISMSDDIRDMILEKLATIDMEDLIKQKLQTTAIDPTKLEQPELVC